jgi:predicted dehydrogenase
VETDLEIALAHDPVAVFISNPTSLHLPVALAAAKSGCHIFLEKPISHSMEGVEELKQEVEKQNLILMVGFQYRFHPALRKIKQWIDTDAIGEIVSTQAHYGEYLPNWHPWENYQNSYSAKKNLGGGVLLTLCHPFDYLRWLLGEINSVCAMTEHRAGFEIDVEDTAQTLLNFENGAIGSVYVDYIERPTARWLHIIGQKGSIHWNDATGKAKLYDGENSKSTTFIPSQNFERNSMFMEEIRHFLDKILKKEENEISPNLEDGIRTLEIVLAAKESATERKWIDV